MKKIRLATIDDIPRILELANSDLNLIGDDSLSYSKEDFEESVLSNLNKIYVYEIGESIVGFILIQLFEKAKYVYIDILIVDPNYRKQGIGTELMNHIYRASNQNNNLFIIFVEINNKEMQQFIEKRGFKRGKQFFFYSKQIE